MIQIVQVHDKQQVYLTKFKTNSTLLIGSKHKCRGITSYLINMHEGLSRLFPKVIKATDNCTSPPQGSLNVPSDCSRPLYLYDLCNSLWNKHASSCHSCLCYRTTIRKFN